MSCFGPSTEQESNKAIKIINLPFTMMEDEKRKIKMAMVLTSEQFMDVCCSVVVSVVCVCARFSSFL